MPRHTGAFWNSAIRPSVCPITQMYYRHAGCLQLSHLRPPEMCGLRTRPHPRFLDPPQIFLSRKSLVGGGGGLLSDIGRRPLRSNSNDMRKLLVPRTHNKVGDRSFSAAGPRLWNDLPPGLRRPGLTLDSFRQSLKTHLFFDRSA